jgi:acyl carrier protein
VAFAAFVHLVLKFAVFYRRVPRQPECKISKRNVAVIDSTKVNTFLEEELGADLSEVGDDSPLFSAGIVDSFGLVNLMMFLEGEGGFRINPVDVNLDNLDTVNRIVEFANRCQ